MVFEQDFIDFNQIKVLYESEKSIFSLDLTFAV